MFYAAFPPEFNSGRMYAGAGSSSLRAAAAAWDGLCTELQSTVGSYSAVVDTLASGPWLGPSSAAMVAAVSPYLAWMQRTAALAAEVATQATAAASAYETAFAGHVPPTEISANRSRLASLVATNIFGQNTVAIAATEVEYAEMWAQDALAMDVYAGASAEASNVSPFTQAPPITNPVSRLLHWGANLSTDYNSTITGLLNSLFGPTGASTFTAMFSAVKVPLGFTTQFNDIGLLTNFPVSQFLKFSPPPTYAVLPKDMLGGGLSAPNWGRGWLTSSVEASMGNAGTLVGKLSIPPSWATATPAIRTVAAALTAAGPQAVQAAALGEGSLLNPTSVAGMLGSAFGAGAPTVVKDAAVRSRLAPIKDLKDKNSPEQLKRLVAQISEKPESVQHHAVDQEGLDALLEQLAKKPGIHAVHLSKGAKVVPSEANSG